MENGIKMHLYLTVDEYQAKTSVKTKENVAPAVGNNKICWADLLSGGSSPTTCHGVEIPEVRRG